MKKPKANVTSTVPSVVISLDENFDIISFQKTVWSTIHGTQLMPDLQSAIESFLQQKINEGSKTIKLQDFKRVIINYDEDETFFKNLQEKLALTRSLNALNTFNNGLGY